MRKIAPDWIKITASFDHQQAVRKLLVPSNLIIWRGYPVYPNAIRPIALLQVQIAASI